MADSVSIRKAELADISLILSFIQRKYEFDHQFVSQLLPPQATSLQTTPLQTTEQRLRDTLFCAIPYAYVTLAEINAQPVGFALYYFCYSSFAARPSIWLDDLFVDSAQRRQGVGSALMNDLINIAVDCHCTHLGWFAHAMNDRAIGFYQKLGAKFKEHHQNRLHFQVSIKPEH